MVYFLHINGYMKVGYSENVARRVKGVRDGHAEYPSAIKSLISKAELVHELHGSKTQEREWHSRLDCLRVPYCGREWFYVTDELVMAIREGLSLEPIIERARLDAEPRRALDDAEEKRLNAIRTELAIRDMERTWAV
jgi:hypothetical protein